MRSSCYLSNMPLFPMNALAFHKGETLDLEQLSNEYIADYEGCLNLVSDTKGTPFVSLNTSAARFESRRV